MYSKQNCPQKLRKLKKAKLDSRVAAILVVRKGKERGKQNKGGGVGVEDLLKYVDLLHCCQECKERTKSRDDLIRENRKMQSIDDDNLLDIMPMLQYVEVQMILVDLEIPNNFSAVWSTVVWIANIGASNDYKACKKK